MYSSSIKKKKLKKIKITILIVIFVGVVNYFIIRIGMLLSATKNNKTINKNEHYL